jgi:biopolymer transport protein ExbD
MRFPRRVVYHTGEYEVAPFAGVLFLLLLFLLLHSSLVFTPGVRVQLPVAADLPGPAGPSVAVAVDATGQFYYENQAIGPEPLAGRLRALVGQTRGKLTLVIQADERVSYQTVVHLSTLARGAGVPEVMLATRPRVLSKPAPGGR